MYILAQQTTSLDKALDQSRNVLDDVVKTTFNGQSILVFLIAMTMALLLGRVVASILRRLTKFIGAQADKTEDLGRVTKLRRIETLIVLSIAALRALLVAFAVYFWWVFTHEAQQTTAILGAGAVFTVILTLALRPALSDLAAGATMMVEHWYGVGDNIRIEPLSDAQGVVERVTLRSTKLRSVTGEIIWVNNKDIMAVSVTPKGVRTIAIELFARDIDKAIDLIDDTNIRLPEGSLAVVSSLSIMIKREVAPNLWHITAISEVAPGREWILDRFAIDIIKELDETYKTLVHTPITRYADSEAERRFARAIHNSRKSRIQRENVVKKVAHKRAAEVKKRVADKHAAKRAERLREYGLKDAPKKTGTSK